MSSGGRRARSVRPHLRRDPARREAGVEQALDQLHRAGGAILGDASGGEALEVSLARAGPHSGQTTSIARSSVPFQEKRQDGLVEQLGLVAARLVPGAGNHREDCVRQLRHDALGVDTRDLDVLVAPQHERGRPERTEALGHCTDGGRGRVRGSERDVGHELGDGRAIVAGTREEAKARAVVARYVGT